MEEWNFSELTQYVKQLLLALYSCVHRSTLNAIPKLENELPQAILLETNYPSENCQLFLKLPSSSFMCANIKVIICRLHTLFLVFIFLRVIFPALTCKVEKLIILFIKNIIFETMLVFRIASYIKGEGLSLHVSVIY